MTTDYTRQTSHIINPSAECTVIAYALDASHIPSRIQPDLVRSEWQINEAGELVITYRAEKIKNLDS